MYIIIGTDTEKLTIILKTTIKAVKNMNFSTFQSLVLGFTTLHGFEFNRHTQFNSGSSTQL